MPLPAFHRARYPAAAAVFLVFLAGCAAGTLPSVHSETERLATARALVAKHDYTDAITMLKTYITNNPGSNEVDHAIYLLGECELQSKDYTAAAVDFERLIREFPESDSSGAAAFGMGEAYFGQSRPPDFDQEFTNKAVEQWRRFQSEYPDHWRVSEAEHRIQVARMRLATKLLNNGNLYVKLGQLGPARVYYNKVEEDYSDLPQLAYAWVGLARCDARELRIGDAIEHLRQVETHFKGRPIADFAAHEIARLSN